MYLVHLLKVLFEITIDNFVDATHKKEPYFQVDTKGKKRKALCNMSRVWKPHSNY